MTAMRDMSGMDLITTSRSLLRYVHRFNTLPLPDRRLLMTTGALLLGVRVGLMVSPYRFFMRCLNGMSARHRPASNQDRPAADRLAWAVETAARIAPDARCLTQALVLQGLMIHHRHPSRLQIGFTRDEQGRIQGHAWVEYQGRIILGGSDAGSRFQPIASMADEGIQTAAWVNDVHSRVDRDALPTQTTLKD